MDPQQRHHSERTNTSAPALAGPFYFGRGVFLGSVALEMDKEFHHQALVTERPVAL